MKRPKIIDKRHIHLEKILRSDYIPFLAGRPKRPTIISNEDILNLRIILNTSNSIDEIIRQL